jgi:hypothetical protein
MRMAATLAGAEAFRTTHRHTTQSEFPFGTDRAGRAERASTPALAAVASRSGARTTPGRAAGAALSGLVDRVGQHLVTAMAVGMLHLAIIKYILLTIGAS